MRGVTGAQAKKARAKLREFALSLPGAYEEFPWEESVAKVNKKVFVFLGVDGGDSPGFSVKLDEATLETRKALGYMD